MRNYIILNGQNSNEISGLLIQSLPPITKPLIRTEIEEIDGRDGDIVTPLGYSSYNKEFTIGLYGNFDVNEVISYFNSEGTVVFSNEPDKYYNYQILDQIDFERLIRFKTATIKMHCQPFKYSKTEGEDILDPPAQNLLSIPDFDKTTNGVTLTVSDGVISVLGTPSAATEFYVPTGGLNFSAGTYTLSAQALGTGVTKTSIRLIGSTPSDFDSFGGDYVGLKNGQEVSLQGTVLDTKTFGYLWFYINTGKTLDFTMTVKVENESEKMASGEGTAFMLLNTADAPFSEFDLKGNTFQQNYTGKNLIKFNQGSYTAQGITWQSDENTNTAHGTGTLTASYTVVSQYEFTNNLPAGTYTISIAEALSSPYRVELSTWDVNDTRVNHRIPLNETSYTLTTSTALVRANVTIIGGTSGSTLDITIKNFQLEAGSTATSFEPYIGGIPSPNPDYPQEVLNVKHQNMIRLTGKNLVSANELYLVNAERTSDGLRQTITSSPLATYYSGSIANPVGVFTISFDARIANPDVATLVFQQAGIWGDNNLRLKDVNGNYADEAYRTLSANWRRFSYTVNATVSSTWTLQRAVMLYFSTYQNSPIFELRNFQIEAGATATSFDGSAPQMYPIDFRTGKNMLSLDFLSVGGLAVSGNVYPDKKYQINNAFAPLKVNPITTYSISANLGTTVMGMRVYVQECDINTVPISGSWKQLASEPYTFTTRGDAEYIKLGFSLSTTSTTVTDETENTTPFNTVNEWLRGTTLQVEEGEATAYEPYESMELCKIGDYQDYIRKLGDDWYVYKEIEKIDIVSTGISAFNTHNGSHITVNYSDSTVKKISTPAVTNASNRFVGCTSTQTWGGTVLNGVSQGANSNYLQFSLPNSVGTTQAEVRTYFENRPTVVYYALESPTDTKITSPIAIATLEAMKNQSHAYEGVTFVSSLPGGGSSLPLISSVEVIKSCDGVVTNAGNFIAKPKLTIYGSGDIGISINGVQIFQIALGEEEYITIDTATMEAYQGSTENLKNRLVTGDYDNFYLNPGDNQITFSGIVAKCIVENYSRWL